MWESEEVIEQERVSQRQESRGTWTMNRLQETSTATSLSPTPARSLFQAALREQQLLKVSGAPGHSLNTDPADSLQQRCVNPAVKYVH